MRFGRITVKDDTIRQGKTTGPLAGATARVETAGQIGKRVSASRVLLMGPLGFLIKKKTDDRELYLTIEGDGFVIVEPVNPTKGKQARQFAAQLQTAAMRAAPTPAAPAASWAPDPTGRAELRYWDGQQWTAHTATAGQQGHDPI